MKLVKSIFASTQFSSFCKHFLKYFLGLFAFALFLPNFSAECQHNFLLYSMQQIPQSNLMNPGQIPQVKEYIGVPFLSGVRIGTGGAGLSYKDLNTIIGRTDEITNYLQIGDQLPRDEGRLLVDTEIQLFNLGAQTKNGFISLSIGDVAYFSGSFLRSVFSLLDDIQQQSINPGRSTYDLSELAASGAYYRSFSLGYAHNLNPFFTIGGRLHWLQGIGGVWTENKNLVLRSQSDAPYFDVSGRLNILSSGLSDLNDINLYNRLLTSGNSGMALDLGGVYKFYELWELSFSVLNLGQINWKKQIDYAVIGDHLLFRSENPKAFIEDWGEAVTDQLQGAPANPNVRFNTPLPVTLFMAYRYNISPETSISLLANAVRYNGSTDIAFAFSGNTLLNDRLGLSGGLSFNQFSLVNLGMGLSMNLGIFQLYAITDNLPAIFNWKNSNVQQVQFGINLNFGKLSNSSRWKSPPVANTEPLPQKTPQPSKKEIPVEVSTPKPVNEASPPEDNTVSKTVSSSSAEAEKEELPAEIVPELVNNSSPELPQTTSPVKDTLVAETEMPLVTMTDIPSPPEELRSPVNNITVSEEELVKEVEDVPILEEELRPSVHDVTISEEELVQEIEDVPIHEEEVAEQEQVHESDADVIGQEAVPDEMQPASQTIYSVAVTASLHQGPVYTSDVIAPLKAGDRVEVIWKAGKWWWKVRYKDKIGFVKTQALQ
ncbi:MAG: DUF5723 family protein [Saprospiraceae bacterium]